jgi:hypothetical protein
MKYFYILFALFCVLFFAGCKISEKDTKNNCEQRLLNAIGTFWKYDEVSNSVKTEVYFLTELDSEKFNCIIGRDTGYIIKMFGRGYNITYELPPRIRNKDGFKLAIEYPLYKPCPTSISGSCEVFQFYFDSNGIVRKYGRMMHSLSVYK